MRKMVLVLLATLLMAGSAMAAVVDNNNIYIWGDPYGDMYDAEAYVSPGETIRLNIFVNDLVGSTDMLTGNVLNNNWTNATNGAWTCIWWDNTVVDGTSVYEDGLGIDTDNNPLTGDANGWEIQNKFKVWMGSTGNNAHGSNYWYKHYDNWNDYGWVAEGRLIISMNLTIREDAPLGMTEIGLEQAFFWSNNLFDEYGGYFFKDRIEVGESDPFAMKLYVVADSIRGDFDNDGDIDADDIDLLMANLGGDPGEFDLTDDGVVDQADVDEWVFNIVPIGENVGTVYGDFNLDGEVNAGDLALLATNYGLAGTWGWATGDGNGDGNVDAGDLAMLATNYGTVVHTVPEPITMSLLAIGGAALLRRRSR